MASPWQTIRQVRDVVANETWSDSPNAEIIGQHQAVITAGVDDDESLPGRLPFALLNLGSLATDEDDPGLVSQEIVLVVCQSVDGHSAGEYHLVGGASSEADRGGYSTGRGLLEIETALLGAVGRLTGADGAPIQVTHASSTDIQRLRGKWVAYRQYMLRAICTREDEYAAPRNFVATGGSGSIVCTWDLPPARFDLHKIVLRYASGATAPTSATSGTGATLASDLATGVTLSLAAGTYSLALFAGYDELQPPEGSPSRTGRYSSADTGSTRTSVVVS